MRKLKWEDIPDESIGWCIKKILQDGLQVSKKNIKSALECFFKIIVVEED